MSSLFPIPSVWITTFAPFCLLLNQSLFQLESLAAGLWLCCTMESIRGWHRERGADDQVSVPPPPSLAWFGFSLGHSSDCNHSSKLLFSPGSGDPVPSTSCCCLKLLWPATPPYSRPLLEWFTFGACCFHIFSSSISLWSSLDSSPKVHCIGYLFSRASHEPHNRLYFHLLIWLKRWITLKVLPFVTDLSSLKPVP